MEKSVLSFPRLAACKLSIALVVSVLLSASINAQPVFVKNINKTSHSFINAAGKIYYASADSVFTASPSSVAFVKKLSENIRFISEVTMGSKFYIVTTTSSGQQGLWVSNGTAASTVKVGSFASIMPLKVFQTDLYLAVNDGVHGVEVWKLSSANALTMLKDINPGSANGYQNDGITISNSQLFFIAEDGTGRDIWRTDGTAAGTVKAVNVPFASIEDLTDVNGTMYFEHDSLATWDYSSFTELWKTQGTPATTQLVKDFGGYYYNHGLYNFTPFKGKLFFLHFMDEKIDLMSSDGTEAGTVYIDEAGYDGSVYPLKPFNDYLLWYGETQGFPTPIAKNTGTAGGTSTVHELNYVYTPPGYDFSYVDLTPAGDRLYFVDHATLEWPTEDQKYVLYESTPTYTPGTSQSMLERYNFPYYNTRNLTAVTGNDVVFTTWDPSSNFYKLWYYDPDAQCSGTGGLTREVWTNITGNKVTSIPLTTPPAYTQTVTSFKGPVNAGDNYGARYSGYLCVPVSGNYKFMIASDDYSELYLSTTSSKADKKLIAYVYGATRRDEFTKFPSQQSALIPLVAGAKYYIEALHKEGTTYDHIMVAMQYPNGTIENPILGSHLIPSKANELPQVNITEPAWPEIGAFADFQIKADVSDDGSIIKVEFFVKSLTYGWENRVGSDTEAPYEASAGYYGEGDYRITVKAYDNANGIGYDSMDFKVIECAATGKIKREVWTNVKGLSVNYIPVNNPPNSTNYLSIFEGPTNVGDYYGARIRGYLCPPGDGEYTFYISSDDHSELWLSDGPNPGNKKRIAYVNGATLKRQWNKYPSQQSVKIFLRRGTRYYVEVLHKENLGYDHISVGWILPNGISERPIPGTRLSPFEPSSTLMAEASDESEMMTASEARMIEVAPNPVTTGKVVLTSTGTEFAEGSAIEVQLVSFTGEVVYTNRIQCDGPCGSLELDFGSNVRPGLYLLKGTDGQNSFTTRLIVK
ncbi:MAG TPA: PA14 domain-containing protein [Chryseosolibacter sp.]|nr:PA14 domain-containing protein [Chryseosolibacter sp.]